jgi:hypothetical protein
MNEIRQGDKRMMGHRHETRDAATGPVTAVIGGLLALLVCALLFGWGLLKVLLAAAPLSSPGVAPRDVVPEEPPLQVSPAKDLAALRAEEDRLLYSTEWVDLRAGIARIPIDQAMALLVKRSKPAGETKP